MEDLSNIQWRFWGLYFGGQWGGHNCSWGEGSRTYIATVNHPQQVVNYALS